MIHWAAGDIEGFVVGHLKTIGKNPALAAETIRQARLLRDERLRGMETDARELRASIAGAEREIHHLATNREPSAIVRLRHCRTMLDASGIALRKYKLPLGE